MIKHHAGGLSGHFRIFSDMYVYGQNAKFLSLSPVVGYVVGWGHEKKCTGENFM